MKSACFVAVLSAFIALANALPSTIPYSLHEKRSRLPRLWRRGDRVKRDAVVPVRIGLTQNNLHEGYEYLMDV